MNMYFLLKMGISACYVSLPEGTFPGTNSEFTPDKNDGWKTRYIPGMDQI